MGKYYKSKELRYKAFYACIIALWNRRKAGKEINASVMIDRFHLGHIKIEPYLRLANQEKRPTFEECCRVRDELSQHQSEMNRKAKEKKAKGCNVFNTEIDYKNLGKALREKPDGEIIAAHFLRERGWILKRPITSYEDFV